MASSNVAWGIEIGQYAIKAIQLEAVGEGVRVRDFAVIPHLQVLTDPKLATEAEEGGVARATSVLEMSLATLATQKQFVGQRIVVNFNWRQGRGLSRFVKVPPVSPKEIPNLVRFEVEQQIPFPIDEIEWDFHAFQSPDSPEVEVGLFAIQKEPLAEFIALVGEKLGVEPTAVTLAPLALYNALAYDRDILVKDRPFVFLDIGTSATDLIVAHGSRCWMRSFPLGGHNFSEAVADEFKIEYRKAEALKQESATSKYAKQIMGAMRPVFGDLIGDVQKSLQFYENQNRGVKLKDVVGLGSTLKIPGLRKFIGMQLNLEVERLDHFEKLAVDGPAAADFAQHVVNFAVAYGLALQGLGMATVDINLLPQSNLRQQVWARKTRWFAAAAAIAVAAGGLMFLRGILDQSAVGDVTAVSRAERVVSQANSNKSALTSEAADVGSKAKNVMALLEDREVWPSLVSDSVRAVAAGNRSEFTGAGREDLEKLLKDDKSPRVQTVLRDLSGVYGVEGSARTITVTLNVDFVPPTPEGREGYLDQTVVRWLEDNKSRPDAPYEIVSADAPIAEIVAMKVGIDGALAAEQSSSASGGDGAAGAAAGSSGLDDGGFARPGGSFSAGGSDGQNFGGVAGKNRPKEGGTTNRPGGRLGAGGATGGTMAGEDPADAGASGAGAGGAPQFNRGAGGGGPEVKAGDLDKIAPIPARPSVFAPNSTVYSAKVRFKVKLKGEAPAAPAAAEGQ